MSEQKEETKETESYIPAIDYISLQTGKLNEVTAAIHSIQSVANNPSLLSAVSDIKDRLSTFSSIHSYLPNIQHLTVASPIIDYSRQATLAISGMSSLANQLAISTESTKLWYEENIAKASVLSATAYSNIINSDTITSFSNLKTIIGTQSLATLSIQASIAKATQLSVYAEKSLSCLTNVNIGSKLAINNINTDHLKSSFVGLSNSYSNLLKSYETNPLTYTQISPSLLKIAPIEYFSSANLLEAISIDEDITEEKESLKNEIQYENEILLQTHLTRLDPRLYKMWKGAIEAYHSQNSDKIRQFTISIRELFSHLFRKLASDEDIKRWSTDSIYYHEGNPTRKARILYVCRNINNDPFKSFIKKDIDATIAFIDIFQYGTHNIDPAFSQNQLTTIKSKAENTIKFLLEIYFTANN